MPPEPSSAPAAAGNHGQHLAFFYGIAQHHGNIFGHAAQTRHDMSSVVFVVTDFTRQGNKGGDAAGGGSADVDAGGADLLIAELNLRRGLIECG